MLHAYLLISQSMEKLASHGLSTSLQTLTSFQGRLLYPRVTLNVAVSSCR